MLDTYLNPLLGGALIGVAVTIMLLFNGRVTGISGIIVGALSAPKKDTSWRLSFIGGLIAGGLALSAINPGVFENTLARETWVIALAGLIVGFGTVMGSGCTSGHGVCGISRFSIRSLLATIVFIGFGVLSVSLFQFFVGGQS